MHQNHGFDNYLCLVGFYLLSDFQVCTLRKKGSGGKNIRFPMSHSWSLSRNGLFVVFGKRREDRQVIITYWRCDDVKTDTNMTSTEVEGQKIAFHAHTKKEEALLPGLLHGLQRK